MSQHVDRWVSPDGRIDLRCGRWQEALADVAHVDAVVTDPPYSARSHAGSDAVASSADGTDRKSLSYSCLSAEDLREFVARWSFVDGWICCLTDSDLFGVWRSEFEAAGRYGFSPVPILQHRPRLSGDGPGSGAVYASVSRPRSARFMSWGSLPCWYHSRPEKMIGVMGAKPLELMRALVRDYSRPGDLICDPCAGGGTTLLAAVMEGRRAIGSEMDPKTYDLAVDRLRGWGPMRNETQPNLFAGIAT